MEDFDDWRIVEGGKTGSRESEATDKLFERIVSCHF